MPLLVLDETPDRAPLNEDFEPYSLVVMHGPQTVYADGYDELLGFFIDGYDALPDTAEGNNEALVLRVQHATALCSFIQAAVCSDGLEEGTFDPENETEEALTAFFGDRTVPVYGIDEWKHAVPLVLVTTDYHPYTQHSAPSGNVWWIDPADEAMFVHSLAQLGVINLLVHEDS